MMQHLTNDPSFWVAFWALMGMLVTAAATLLGLLIAWAKARTAEYEARAAKGTADSAIAGQTVQQATLVQHGEAIAALQGAGGSSRGQGTAPPVVPAAPVPTPAAPLLMVPPVSPEGSSALSATPPPPAGQP